MRVNRRKWGIISLTGTVGFFFAIAPVLDPYIVIEIGSGFTLKINDIIMIFLTILCFSRSYKFEKKTGFLCIWLQMCIRDRYKEGLKDLPVSMNPMDLEKSNPNYWISCLIIDEEAMCKQVRGEQDVCYVKEAGKTCPTEILEAIASINAEGRPIWKPMHMQPIYRLNPFVVRDGNGRARSNAYIAGDVADVGIDLFARGLCLPSDNKMCIRDRTVTCQEIAKAGNEIWIRIPSGWICAENAGTVYVKNEAGGTALSEQSKNSWVRELQHQLNLQFSAGLAEDGIAGPETLAACITCRPGARGEITRLIQSKGGSTADGIWGNNTTAAVRAYQSTHGLTADGIVGKDTWRAMLGL